MCLSSSKSQMHLRHDNPKYQEYYHCNAINVIKIVVFVAHILPQQCCFYCLVHRMPTTDTRANRTKYCVNNMLTIFLIIEISPHPVRLGVPILSTTTTLLLNYYKIIGTSTGMSFDNCEPFVFPLLMQLLISWPKHYPVL